MMGGAITVGTMYIANLKADALYSSCCICLQVCTAVMKALDQGCNAAALYYQCYAVPLVAYVENDVCCFRCILSV